MQLRMQSNMILQNLVPFAQKTVSRNSRKINRLIQRRIQEWKIEVRSKKSYIKRTPICY